MSANLFICFDELGSGGIGEFPAAGLVDVRADGYFITNLLVGLRVLPRNRAGSDYSDSQRIDLLEVGRRTEFAV
jgi:hypothetical protein